MVTPAARREAVAHLIAVHEMSERRACQVIGGDRSSVRYRSIRPDDAGLSDAAIAHRDYRFSFTFAGGL